MFNHQVVYNTFLTNHARSPIHGTLSEIKLNTRLLYTKRRVHFTCNLQMPHDHFTDIFLSYNYLNNYCDCSVSFTQPKNDIVV